MVRHSTVSQCSTRIALGKGGTCAAAGARSAGGSVSVPLTGALAGAGGEERI